MFRNMLGWLAVPAVALMFVGCDVDVRDGNLPDVDATPDEASDIDVRVPELPDVDIRTEEKTITVPDVDINSPTDDDG